MTAAKQPAETTQPEWLRTPVADELVLRTLPGAVDYLADSLSHRPGVTIVKRHPDAVRISWRGPLAELAEDRYFSSAAVPLRPDSEILAVLGATTFRVGDIGPERFELVKELEEERGWRNDPRDWEVNVERRGDELVAEIGALHTTRRFGRMERLPASTTPVLAAVLTRLLKVEPGQIVLDPFCGAGTNLVYVRAMTEAGVVLGADRDRRALAAARKNGQRALFQADAAHLPFADGSIDRVVANLPFGKRVGSHRGNEQLYPAFLRELDRILAPKARAVLLTEDKRLLRTWAHRVPGLRPVKEVVLASGGAHPSAFVLTNRATRTNQARPNQARANPARANQRTQSR